MVAVALGRWRLREVPVSGFDLTFLVFWEGGRLWEVGAYGRWSRVEVRLYFVDDENQSQDN